MKRPEEKVIRLSGYPPETVIPWFHECLVCGHMMSLAVWRQDAPDIGVCDACRNLAAVNRGPCSPERDCRCSPPVRQLPSSTSTTEEA